MKAVFPALPCVDSQANELEGALTKGGAKDGGSGFDTLLALASAQATEHGRAVKPLAPTMTVQPAAASLTSSALLAQELGIALAAEHQLPAADAAQWPQSSTVDAVHCPEPEPPTALESHLALSQTPARSLMTPLDNEQTPQEDVPATGAGVQFTRLTPPPVAAPMPEVQRVGIGEPNAVITQAAAPTGMAAASPRDAREAAVTTAEQAPEREANTDAAMQEAAALQHALTRATPRTPGPIPALRAQQLTEPSSDALAAPPPAPAMIQPGEPATSRAAPTRSPIKAPSQDAASVSVTTSPRPTTGASHTATSPAARIGLQTTEEQTVGPADPNSTAANGPRKSERSRSASARDADPDSLSAPPLHPPALDRSVALASQAAIQSAPAPVAPSNTLRQPALSAPTVAASKSTRQYEKLEAVSEHDLGSNHPQSPDAGPRPFADLLHDPHPAGSQVSEGTTDAGVASAEATAPQREVQPLHVASDPDTGARVVDIEYFSAAASAARPSQDVAASDVSATRVQLATGQLEATRAGERQDDAGAADTAAGMDASATLEQEPSLAGDEHPSPNAGADRGSADARDGAFSGHEASSQDRSQPRAQTFQATEVQGMRGLDAVVASLLRAGKPDEAARGASRPERATFAAPMGPANTEKSQASKSAEKAAALLDGQRKDAMEREAERALEQDPACLEPLPLHVQFEPRVHDERSAELKVAAVPLPTPASPPPDPDLATMGKLARGEGVNGASIAIEHPELGPMKVLVRNENGRIDVRAVLETPRAAAVLRAHESALRYGIQQAGMTFGALRVRTRSGEPEPVKTHGTTKRRRGQEWEA